MSYVSLGWAPGSIIEGLKKATTKSAEASAEASSGGGPGFFSKFKGVTSSIGKGVAAAGKAATEAPQEDSWLSKGLSFLSTTAPPLTAAQAASKAAGHAKALAIKAKREAKEGRVYGKFGGYEKFIVPIGIGAAVLLYLMMSRK